MKKSKMCKVSGGNLPDGYEVKIDVELDYTDVEGDEILNRAVSHDIIGVQRTLRLKTTSELNQLAETGYKFNAALIGTRVTVDAKAAYVKQFIGMTEDERTAQLAELAAIHKANKANKTKDENEE